jgi:aspartyl-tRNA(Asn)/glutamyl-tRNA(Gln) amidotransferase subunit C
MNIAMLLKGRRRPFKVAISEKQVEQVAYLARLKITEQEKQLFAQQLTAILEYVEKLNELNTEQVEPLHHILPIYNVFRDDEVKPSVAREEILARSALDAGLVYEAGDMQMYNPGTEPVAVFINRDHNSWLIRIYGHNETGEKITFSRTYTPFAQRNIAFNSLSSFQISN